jgi:hypothetical protein
MNVLDAYISQKKKLTIVISSLNISLIKDIGRNLSKDLGSKVIDLTDYMIVNKIDDLEIENINSKDTDATIKIIICPFYPDGVFNFRINYHINISLNKQILEEKKIDHKLINLNNEISKSIRVNKFLNLHKYENNKLLEDDIFKFIMDFIKKKLDNGKYLDRIKNLKEEGTLDEFEKMENNPHNNKIDHDIMEDVIISSQDSFSDSNISELSVEDINMDDERTLTKDFSDDKQFGGINIDDLTDSVSEYLYKKISNNNEVSGSRQIKYKSNIDKLSSVGEYLYKKKPNNNEVTGSRQLKYKLNI